MAITHSVKRDALAAIAMAVIARAEEVTCRSFDESFAIARSIIAREPIPAPPEPHDNGDAILAIITRMIAACCAADDDLDHWLDTMPRLVRDLTVALDDFTMKTRDTSGNRG
jgi:hypothetical protein